MLTVPLVASIIAPSARAQRAPTRTQAWLDVGSAQVRQPESDTRMTGSAGGGVWHQRGTLALIGEGAMSFASDSLAAAQLVLRTAWAPRTTLGWLGAARTDLDLVATTVGLVMPGRSGTRSASLQQSLQRGPVTLSAHGGLGTTSRFGAAFEGHAFGAALAAQHRGWELRAHAQRSATDDWQLMEAARFGLRRQAAMYVMDDHGGALAWRGTVAGHAVGVQASRTWRDARYPTFGKARVDAASVSWQFTSTLLLVAQAGQQLADVVRGVPQARYVGASVRWIPSRTPRATARAADGVTPANADALPVLRAGEVQLVRDASGGALQLSIDAPAGSVVEVACSATEWAPVAVAHDGARFTHRLVLPRGTHKVAVRVGGGAWRAPRGLAAVDDGFGGTAGVVVVP